MDDSIINKLNKFLKDHDPIIEECHIIYLLVEIRKILDRSEGNINRLPILRFYCDWVLHTEKSRKLNVIAPIVKGIEDTILSGHKFSNGLFLPSGDSHIKFIYKEELQKSMNEFFCDYGLPTNIFSKEKWEKFVFTLIQVLIDQPLVLNGEQITSMCFRPAVQAANLEVRFRNGVVHRFLNVF